MPSTSHGKQKQADEVTLTHYLTSIHELYLLTVFPEYQSDISTGIYEALLLSHAEHFRSLSHPFGSPSAKSRSAVQSGTAVFPGTSGVSFEVYEGEGKIACLISDRLGIDEVEALVLFRRFRRDEHELMEAQQQADDAQRAGRLGPGPSRSKDRPLSDTLLNLIVEFYWQEHASLAHLLSALLRRSNDDSDVTMEELLGGSSSGAYRDVKAVAIRTLDEIIGQDRKAFVYQLFTHFGTAMQIVVSEESEELLRAGIIHNLELQVAILESLLLYNYFGAADITANLSRGLINGTLACSFGAAQANRRLIERFPGSEAQDLLFQIQHLLALICIDSLRLNDLLEEGRVSLDYDVVQNLPEEDRSLAQSPQHIVSVHDNLGTASCRDAEPYALVLLAWACFLGRLQDQSWLLPPSDRSGRSGGSPVHVKVGQIALDPQFDVFAKWQRLLTGRLLWQEHANSSSVEDAAIYKDISKVLLSALPQLVRFSYVPDYYGLLAVWTSCYGQGEAHSVAPLCYSAWHSPDTTGWTELLQTTQFPHHAGATLRLLTAMAGAGSVTDAPTTSLLESSASAASTLELLQAMPALSVEVGTSSRLKACCDSLRDEDGVGYLVNRRPLRLPGGAVMAAGSSGRVISRPGSESVIVRWDGPFNVLGLLVAIIAASTGNRSEDEQFAAKQQIIEGDDVFQNPSASLMWLKLDDIGMASASLEDGHLLGDILDLLLAVMRAEPSAAEAFAQLAVTPQNPGGLSAILLRFVRQKGSRVQNNDSATLLNIAVATDVVANLAEHSPGPVWDVLRRPNFFLDANGTPSIARSIVSQELRKGFFPWTSAMLRMLQVLSRHFLSQRLTEPTDIARQQEEALYKAMSFAFSFIWADFGNWRYQRSEDKARIGEALCELLILWFSDPLFDKALEAAVAGRTVCSLLRESFLISPSPLTLQPLLQAIRMPYTGIPALLQRNRKAEAAQVETHLVNSLALLALLLRRAQRTSPRTAALETMLVSPMEVQGTVRNRTLVDVLFHYSSSRSTFNERVAEHSIRVNTVLARNLALIQNNSAPMLTCLDDAALTIADLVAIIRPPYRSAMLVREAWTFLKTAAIAQPGLARIALRVGRGDGTTASEQASAHEAAKQIVADAFDDRSSQTWDTDPRLIASALDFLVAAERCMPDAIDKGEGDSKFWKSIDKICRTMQAAPAKQTSAPRELEEEDLEAAQRNIEEVTAYAYRRKARSLSLDLLAGCLSGAARNTGRAAALKLLADRETCPGLIAEAAHSSIDVDLHRTVYDALLPDSSPVGMDDLKDPGPKEDRYFGVAYLFDVDATLIALGRNTARNEPLSLALQMANADWSAADADSLLTQSWTNLLVSAEASGLAQLGTKQNLLVAAARILPQLSETRQGLTIVHIQAERLELLRAAVATACQPEAVEDQLQLGELVDELTAWFSDPVWAPQVLARDGSASQSYTTAFEVILILVGQLARSTGSASGRPGRQAINRLVMSCVAAVATSLAVRSDVERGFGSRSADDDLALFYAVLHATTARSLNPDGPLWLSILDDRGILRSSLAWIASVSLDGASPLAATRSILQFHAGAMQHPAAADALRRLHFVSAYVESALLNPAPGLYQSPGEETAPGLKHDLWTQALAVVNDFFVTLAVHGQPDIQEVESVIDRIKLQAGMVLTWDLDTSHPIERLSDLQQVTDLFYHLVHAAGAADRTHETVMTAYAPQALKVLNAIAAAFGTTLYLRQVVQEALQNKAAANNVAREPTDSDVDAQITAVKASLLAIGHVVVQTLLAWTGTTSILRKDQTEFLARPRRLASSDSSGLASPVQELLDFAAAISEESDSLGTARGSDTAIDSAFVVAQQPATPASTLITETIEMTTLVAAGQAILMWESASEEARRAADKASDAAEGEGKRKAPSGSDEMSGQDKQSLRDLKDFVSKMADKQDLYRDCYTMLRYRIPHMDDL